MTRKDGDKTRKEGRKEGLTFTTKGMLELNAPFSLGPVQLKHSNAHDENHQGSNKFEDACFSERSSRGSVSWRAERKRKRDLPREVRT